MTQPSFGASAPLTISSCPPEVESKLCGLGVTELFPEGCAADLAKEEYTNDLDEDHFNGSEDSDLPHKQFVARVTADVDKIRESE